MSAGGGTRAVVAALGANLGIAATRFVAFGLTASSSLLAEAISTKHPFGYGRERYLYAFVVSAVLFSVGGLFAVYEGIHKITAPEPITR